MLYILVLLILMDQSCLMVSQLYEYLYINEEKTWTEAQQYCREKHTDLATVSNMTDMKRLLSTRAGHMKEAWIGLYDQTDGDRTWYWSLPGVEFNESETNWNENEPNNVMATQNCGIIWRDRKWGDESCNKHFYYLCYNETNALNKFYLSNEKKTWLEAQTYCREKHTDLISGLDQLENEQLKDTFFFSTLDQSERYIFTGLFRDTWRWSDENSFSFRHWNLKFDNQIYNSGQCAMTVFNDGGRWRNETCEKKRPFICYDDKVILVKEKMNWEDALYYCRDHYHDLVTITSLDEQRWIQEKAKKASTDYVWMGLRYTCTLDFWFWVSDEVVRYKNWASGEPVDDCDMSGAMETGGGHKWRKINDLEEFNFLCSKS
ncbi:C-type mannose receptor 2-like [Cyprinodon tularosa]|uniref:C-type mannose receptor 2-like n=1 Tax=Cyprinodon tularosa TaxID=77115 RepID=UPI0018E1DCD3|nr:C-type mannose receptor 2-like [Cyprinodon tularosa]